MKINHLFFLILGTVVLFSCNSSQQCKYAEPIALFDVNNPAVVKQSFNLKGMASNEYVAFDNGLRLELLQDGCKALTQEYRFEIPDAKDSNDSRSWCELSVQLFRYLGTSNQNIFQMADAWANLIEEQKSEIRLGQEFPIAPGFGIKIDKLMSKEFATLIVTIKESDN